MPACKALFEGKGAFLEPARVTKHTIFTILKFAKYKIRRSIKLGPSLSSSVRVGMCRC